MQKNYRFSKKQEGTINFDCSRGADLKVKFDSSKKHPSYGRLKIPLPQVMLTLELDGYGWQ